MGNHRRPCGRRAPRLAVRVLLLLAVLIAACGTARASAFSIAELGVRASGMGTAFIAVADDGSALYFNPAGIAFQPGTRMQMDSLVVVGLFRFMPSDGPAGQVTPDNGFSGSIKPHFIPVASMYMTRQISDRLTFGFGMFTPFGLSANFTNFNDSDPNVTKYPGRFAGTRARLESFWFQPTVAYRIRRRHSLAVGLALVHTHLLIEKSMLNPKDDALTFGREAAETVFPGEDTEWAARSIARMLPEGRSRVAGTSNSPAFSLGYLYKDERLKTNVGLMFRSAVTNHLRGKASFAFGTGYALEQFIDEDLLGKAFPNQAISGSFTTPATYGVGVATSRFRNILVAADFRLQDYRRFSSVPVNFSITQATNPDVRTPAEERLVFDFRNSYQLAFGMEKQMKRSFWLRAGYMYDRSPVVDKSVGPLFPDANRHSFTIGATRRSGNKEMTVFYEAMKFVNRVTDVAGNANVYTNGEYRNFAHLAGVSIRMRLGSRELD